MPDTALPGDDPSVPPADLDRAAGWLSRHGLAHVPPTPLLAARLAVRRRTHLAARLMLAGFIIAMSLTYVLPGRRTTPEAAAPYRQLSLLILTAVVVALVLAQSMLHWRVRRTDRRFAATLSRRVTHPARLAWHTLLGMPRTAVTVVAFAGTLALAARALGGPDATTRYAAVVMLIGVCGVAATMLVHLRHVLTHPVVAEDEASLSADVIMRIEDARDVAAPTVLWALPIASVFGTAIGWWNAAWLVFVVLNAAMLTLVQMWTARSAAVAAHAIGVPVHR